MPHSHFAILLASLASFSLNTAELRGEAYLSLYAPACPHEVKRAGDPFAVSRCAVPGNTCDYHGYYVGGGASTYRSQGRCAHQGTWGWDYVGRHLPRVVRLGWWHPPREQGGTGSYEPDGPILLQESHGEADCATEHE